jgi:hypothetical protein
LATFFRAAAELDLPELADSGYEGAGHGIKTPSDPQPASPKVIALRVRGLTRRPERPAVRYLKSSTMMSDHCRRASRLSAVSTMVSSIGRVFQPSSRSAFAEVAARSRPSAARS